MEAHDVLADNVNVTRPILFEGFGLLVKARVISESSNIVAQCVKPHIHYVLRVKVNGNTPFEAGS